MKLKLLRDSLRKNPKYEILYTKIKRKMLIHGKKYGETITPQLLSLPQLSKLFGEEFAPKGFENSETFNNFLLTEDRYHMLKQVENIISGLTEEIGNAGFILSGPFGIGKSSVGLLLACYAFLNNHFLVYIVSIVY